MCIYLQHLSLTRLVLDSMFNEAAYLAADYTGNMPVHLLTHTGTLSAAQTSRHDHPTYI